MGGYRVELTPAAQRQLERLRGPALLAMRGVILGLAVVPLPPSAGKIGGSPDLWRIRVRVDGDPWRVVYQLDHGARRVIVTRVVRRDEASYRRVVR